MADFFLCLNVPASRRKINSSLNREWELWKIDAGTGVTCGVIGAIVGTQVVDIELDVFPMDGAARGTLQANGVQREGFRHFGILLDKNGKVWYIGFAGNK